MLGTQKSLKKKCVGVVGGSPGFKFKFFLGTLYVIY